MKSTGKVRAAASVAPTVLRGAEHDDDLVPYTTLAVQVDQAPLLRGIPRVPQLWCSMEPVLSADGVMVSTGRPTPQEIDTGSDIRFLADREHWDSTTGHWSPIHGGGGYLFAPALRQPVLEDDEYLQGEELLQRTSFRVSEGRHFVAQFNRGMDYYGTLTISLVLAPHPMADDYPILDYINPVNTVETPSPTNRFALWMTDKIDYHWGGTGGSVDPVVPVSKYRPLMLTMTIEPPLVTVYASYSARHHFFTTKATQHEVGDIPLRFALGNDWKNTGGADYSLYEVNLWPRPLSAAETIELHRKYTSTYGMHSDFA